MWLPFIGPIIERVVGVVDKLIPDADMAAKIKAEATLAAMQLDYSEMQALIESRAKVIAAEYTDGSWLSRSWRPITMLVFTGVVGFNYLLAPIASLDPIPMPTELWELLKLGLGGYLVGRSAEKIVPEVAKIMKKGG